MRFVPRLHSLRLLGLLAGLCTASASHADVVFNSNFESGRPAGLTGWSVESMGSGSDGSFSSYGFSGTQWMRNPGPFTTATLTLTGLAAHTTVSLDFLMALMDSFDGGDNFQIRVDGNTVYTFTFASFGDGTPTAGTTLVGNKQLSGTNGQFWSNDYGFDMSSESALHNISHTSSTLTIEFYAAFNEVASNEGIAIDNLVVSTNANATAVPEPFTAGLLATALIGLRRRRIAIS